MTPQDVVEHLEVVQAVPTRPHCSGSPTAPSSRSVLKPSGPKSSAGRRASGPSTLRAAADSGHAAESDRSRVLSGWWGLIGPVGTQLHVKAQYRTERRAAMMPVITRSCTAVPDLGLTFQ